LTSGPAACFNIKHAPNLRFDAAKTNSPVPNYPLLTSRSTPLPVLERYCERAGEPGAAPIVGSRAEVNMRHDVWLESLRRAAGDPDALGRVLAEDLPTDALQHIGDAVLGVPERAGTDLTQVVDRLVDRLRQRQWDGDDELADTSTTSWAGTRRRFGRCRSHSLRWARPSVSKRAPRTTSTCTRARSGSTP
jgi:hypothetical protein